MSEHQEEWGEWQIHDGKGCPIPMGTHFSAVDVGQDGVEQYFETTALGKGGFSWDWQWSQNLIPGIGKFATRIIRYRILRPRGMAILNAILADLPAPTEPMKTEGVIA